MVLRWIDRTVIEAEEEYSRLQLEPVQKQIVDMVSGLLCQYVPLSKLAMKGFAWRSIIKWQQNNRRPLSDVEKMNAEQKTAAAKEIFDNLEVYLIAVLHNKENETVIRDGIHKALKFYKDNYANRA
ncbi:MAG: hypothetical protein ACFFD4_14575 [Candidatus Odinarchaeota archaeon]